MRNTAKDRFQYHPDPDRILSRGFWHGSLRSVDARKEAILGLVNLKDKSVLDLGCGFGEPNINCDWVAKSTTSDRFSSCAIDAAPDIERESSARWQT